MRGCSPRAVDVVVYDRDGAPVAVHLVEGAAPPPPHGLRARTVRTVDELLALDLEPLVLRCANGQQTAIVDPNAFRRAAARALRVARLPVTG